MERASVVRVPADTNRIEWPASEDERDRRRSIGLLAGALFCAGAALSVVGNLLLESPLPSWLYLLTGVGLLSGLVCFVIPWRRISSRWIHVVAVVATLEVSIAVWATGIQGGLFLWLYTFIAIMVAYSFRSRRTVAAYLVLLSVGMAVPIIDAPISVRESLRDLLVGIPSLIIAATIVTYFREKFEASQQALRLLARLDPLTGVGNYRTLHERLNYEIGRHGRQGRRLTVTVLDLNNFKDVNTACGHLEGDRVLRDVGRALSETAREQDTVARQGGDEFSVLAPETGPSGATTLAARIREALGTITVGDRPVTVSIGWAIYPDDGVTPEALLACADSALLKGKGEQPDATERVQPAVAPKGLPTLGDVGGAPA